MRASWKGLCSLMLLVVFTFWITTVAKAETVTKEGVSVEIVTDKESYAAGEKMQVTVSVSNQTEEELTDVNVRVHWPEGMTFANEEEKILVVDTLAAGESKSFEITGVQEAAWGSVILIGAVVVLLVFGAVAVILVWKKKGKTAVTAAMLVAAMLITMLPSFRADAGVTVHAQKQVTVGKEETVVSATVSCSQFYLDRISRVVVHDPSVVYDPQTQMYYIFGSHLGWAKSEDLISWTSFKNNLNTDYAKIFADPAKWAAKGGDNYNVSGNMWAPDVVYNEAMGKWTMYMSINGDNWYSSIVLLTADRIDGDWTYVGPVVYSGFTNKSEAKETDFYDVYTGTDFPSRYNESRNGNHIYGMNAIDPCVFYDEEGKLWMAYGSWFGGIYLLELDPQTGLRLSEHTYETIENVSDEYQGIKIAGGKGVSGEGAYIEYVNGYYYLYLSYGGLTSTGGYNMRMFRSEKPEGPYVDLSGDSPIAEYGFDNINGEIGVRVMGNYQWDFTKSGAVAQGHNSVYSDENGTFLVYHSRFTNQGEGHSVRVHQQFQNEDGWLVTAPFDYAGEALSYVEKEDVTGDYKVIRHNLKINYAGKKCNETVDISIKEDGTITGDFKGTWKFSEKLGAPYVTMIIDDVEYNGVFLKQRRDNATHLVMTFTILGDNEINVWGYQPVAE